MNTRKAVITGIVSLSLTALLHGFSPDLASLLPRGGTRGDEVEIHLRGHRMFEPQELIAYREGITVKSLTRVNDKHLKAVVAIAPDAPLGQYPFRLRCKGGISYMHTFWVGQFPCVEEVEPNHDFSQPQVIALNSTVHGVAGREDADYYRISAQKGQRISAELEAMRLGTVFFDPYLAILDSRNFELATSDDTALLRQDAFVSIIAPEDGEYTLLVRESSYEGNDKCRYRLHVGGFARPVGVYPPAGKPGVASEYRMIGDPLGDFVMQATPVGTEGEHYDLFSRRDGLMAPSPNPVLISSLPFVNEHEPNGESRQATPASPAEALVAPCALHGIIGKRHDVDWFRFHAKKGQSLRVRALARSLRSPLDTVMILRDANGMQIARNDDQGGLDSIIDFKPPADGDYFVNVRDQLGRGGPAYVYRVEIDHRKPALSAAIPTGKRYDSQYRKMICVPRGNRFATVVNVSRANLSCECKLSADSLPQGVSMRHSTVPAHANNFLAVFEARADAPIAGGLHRFTISDSTSGSGASGRLMEHIDLVEQNNVGVFHSVHDDRVAVAVIEEAPFRIELQPPPVPLVQNGADRLRIKLHRRPGFDEAVKVTLPWKPPGLGSPSDVMIPKGENEAHYDINASGDAAVGHYQICVLAEANTKQGHVVVSSSLQKLSIAQPMLAMSLEMASTIPGQNTSLVGKVEHHQPIPGEAEVLVHGLPHGVTTTSKKINASTKEVVFALKVAGDAPKGKHSAIFCQVLPRKNGHVVSHNTGFGGTLIINPPPPQKSGDQAGKKAVTTMPSKPLSRLEQLRQRKKQ